MMKRLIVLSLDAMVYEDITHLENAPCFKKLLKEGSRVNRMRTIYPSLTYPVHTSILTGTRAGRHGIVNNEPSIPGNLKCDWFWFHEPVKVRDLHDVAKAAGMVTASVFWPVTGRHPSIDHLVAEYWVQDKEDTLKSAYTRAGTSQKLYELAVIPHYEGLSKYDYPDCDEAKLNCACEIIKHYKPHLLTIHLGQIDGFRHKYGIFNDMVTGAVTLSEKYLKALMDACRSVGIYEDTNFVVLSDHGQLNYTRRMNINKIFVEEGFIKLDEENNFVSADAWVKAAGMSAHVHLSNPADKEIYNAVEILLHKLADSKTMGVERIYTAREAELEEGLFGDFSFVLEGDGSTLFSSDWRSPLFSPVDEASGYKRASHGHHPDKGPQPVFLAMGPSVKSGIVIERADIIDVAPTLAHFIGVELPGAEGKPLADMLL